MASGSIRTRARSVPARNKQKLLPLRTRLHPHETSSDYHINSDYESPPVIGPRLPRALTLPGSGAEARWSARWRFGRRQSDRCMLPLKSLTRGKSLIEAVLSANEQGTLCVSRCVCVCACVLVRAAAQVCMRAHAHGRRSMCVHRMLCRPRPGRNDVSVPCVRVGLSTWARFGVRTCALCA